MGNVFWCVRVYCVNFASLNLTFKWYNKDSGLTNLFFVRYTWL